MSTLKVNTVQHNTSGFNNVVQFTDGAGTQNGTLCRAWVNFNGSGTVAIRASFNVSSITDNGLGTYTVNFSNAMSDANYCVAGTANLVATTANSYPVNPLSYSTTSCQIDHREAGTQADSTIVNVAIFR